MANFNATNQNLYNNGGSGDNLIQNGLIKSGELVWTDTFNFTSVLTTADTVCIGTIPANSTITSVEVILPPTFAPTTATINVGVSGSTSLFISSSTAYIAGNAAATGSTVLTLNRVTMNNISGFLYTTTTGTVVVSGGVLNNSLTRVFLSIGVTAQTAPTAGTIGTLIRYTQ